MKKPFYFFLICLSFGSIVLPLLACAAGYSRETIEYDGIERTYFVYLPPDFSKDAGHPLLIVLHGGGGRAETIDGATNNTLSIVAAERGVVMIAPQGVNKQWNDGREEVFRGWHKRRLRQDDVGFISLLIDTMQRLYGIDSRRVYATGISNGGFMSIRLAMDLSHKIAAVAPVTAQISEALRGRYPDQPISIMIINGTADPLVPYDGGFVRVFKFTRHRGKILSTKQTIEIFCRHNGCNQQPEIRKIPDNDPNDGASATEYYYTNGKKNTEVVLVRVDGGGHTWPGGTQYLSKKFIGGVCNDFNASEMILDFLLRHSR